MNKTPKLRFPEFSGEWEETIVEKIANVSTGSKDTKDKIDNGQFPFYVRSPIIERINTFSFEGEAVLTVGDGVGVGKVFHYVNGRFDFHQRVYKISDFKEYNGKFFYQYFAKNFCKEAMKYNAKTSVDSVRREMITKMKIPDISLKEQQKIANFFFLIDKKIQKQQEKVEALKDYKKGMMQKIFSQAIRFKGDNGEEYPEWEEKKAEKLFESISDKKHNAELEVLSATQDRGVIPRSELNIDIKYEESSLSSYKRVRKNNFIISLRSFQGGIETSKYDGLVSPAYTVFNFKENEKQNHDFFSLIFKSRNFINRLNTLIYGIRDGKAISFKDFAGVKLQYPCIEEQEKIALFFLVIYKKLEKEQEKLDSLNEWKKGLLQQMFV
ncbi:restriction endonuclease subunit S [Clostridium botulinum]